MFGHLVPCGGGKSVVLNKVRLVLGHRTAVDEGSGATAHDVELRFIDGWWHVRKMDAGRPLQVNGDDCEAARLNPNDVMSIGGKFYRITFEPPEPVAVSAPPKPIPPPPSSAEGLPLGMLIPCGGGPSIALRKQKILIGRAPGCDVVLPEPKVSSRHCVLELIDGYWQLLDLDSTNGTTVDGMQFHRKWVLPGSVLGLTRQRFRLEYQPKGARPALDADDEVVLPKRSLTDLVGLNGQRLERLLQSQSEDGTSRVRWSLEE